MAKAQRVGRRLVDTRVSGQGFQAYLWEPKCPSRLKQKKRLKKKHGDGDDGDGDDDDHGWHGNGDDGDDDCDDGDGDDDGDDPLQQTKSLTSHMGLKVTGAGSPASWLKLSPNGEVGHPQLPAAPWGCRHPCSNPFASATAGVTAPTASGTATTAARGC